MSTKEQSVRLFAFSNKDEATQKAEEWLRKHGIDYEWFNLNEKKPTKEELKRWMKEDDFKKDSYLKEDSPERHKADEMTDEELAAFLLSHLDQLNLPILEINRHAKVFGFSETKYQEYLG